MTTIITQDSIPKREPMLNGKTRRRAGTVADCADRLMSVDCCRFMRDKIPRFEALPSPPQSKVRDESTQITRFRCFNDNVY